MKKSSTLINKKEVKDFLPARRIKILTSKQMLQRLPIALAQVKAGHTNENLLNEIRQIIYSLYREKKILKKYIRI